MTATTEAPEDTTTTTTNVTPTTSNDLNRNGNGTTETIVPNFHLSSQATQPQDWKVWARRSLYITYFTFMLIIIPVLIYQLISKGADFSTIIRFIAAMATIFAVPISLWGILNHLIYFTQPKLQRHIIRILWMVPIYGIFSCLALSFPVAGVYLDAVREIYQAYVVYNFISYLINFLTDEYDMFTRMKEKPQMKSPPPCCCFKAGANELIINRCKYGVLNYTVLRPILTAVAIICEVTGNYDDASLQLNGLWLWITLALAISQLWAIYCLALLYQSTKEELQPLHRPYYQFLCVKMTIFGANFQGLIIAVVVGTGAFPIPDGMATATFAALVQDFVVCIEMVIASIAHAFSFSYKPYKYMGERPTFTKSLKMMFDVSDVGADVSSHVKRFGRKVKRKFTKTPPKDDAELVENEETADGDLSDENDEGGECDLGTVNQINGATYSVNGRVRMFPNAPVDNNMTPRGAVESNAHNNDITDILGQAEATLEANAMKGAYVSDSFGSDVDAMDLGLGVVDATHVPSPMAATTSSTKKKRDKKGVVIDYDLDDVDVPDLQVDTVMTFQSQESEA